MDDLAPWDAYLAALAQLERVPTALRDELRAADRQRHLQDERSRTAIVDERSRLEALRTSAVEGYVQSLQLLRELGVGDSTTASSTARGTGAAEAIAEAQRAQNEAEAAIRVSVRAARKEAEAARLKAEDDERRRREADRLQQEAEAERRRKTQLLEEWRRRQQADVAAQQELDQYNAAMAAWNSRSLWQRVIGFITGAAPPHPPAHLPTTKD